ncbi:MAG: enoyl-CoA hydratase/isomerase family protein, partial [Xanthobacteraceae bacterium]
MTDASPHAAAVLHSVDRRGVATLTLNRPEKGNRYSQAMLDTLLAEMTRLGAEPAVRVIVLRAGGKHFCVGAEIGEEQPAVKEKSRATLPGLCLAFDEVPKPTVALVHGGCIGGGIALVSCCDIVIAARDAFFSLPEVRLGFAPGPLIPFFLRAVEARSLRRYLLSGERFAA